MTAPPPNYPPTPPPPPPGGDSDGPAPVPPKPPRRSRLTGAFLGIVFVIVLIGVGLQVSNGPTVILGGFILAVVVSTIAMASTRTRSYAAGFLIAVAATAIVLGGACIGLIALVSQSV